MSTLLDNNQTPATFSFYGSLEQSLINRLTDEYDIDSCDITEKLEHTDLGIDFLKSPNQLIYAIFECIIDQMFQEPIFEYLSEEYKETLRDLISESQYVNSIDCSIDADGVFNNEQDNLEEDLVNNNQEFVDDEELLDEKMTELKTIFNKYTV